MTLNSSEKTSLLGPSTQSRYLSLLSLVTERPGGMTIGIYHSFHDMCNKVNTGAHIFPKEHIPIAIATFRILVTVFGVIVHQGHSFMYPCSCTDNREFLHVCRNVWPLNTETKYTFKHRNKIYIKTQKQNIHSSMHCLTLQKNHIKKHRQLREFLCFLILQT